MPSRQAFSRSEANDRLNPSTPAKAIATHSTAGSSRSVSSRAVSKAKLKRKTMSSPKTHMEARVSRFLHSTRRSFSTMLQMIFRLFIATRPIRPHNPKGLERRLVERAVIANSAGLERNQTLSQRSPLLEIVRGKKQGLAPFRQAQKQIFQLLHRVMIQAREWFVENYKFRIVEKGARQ